MADICRYAFIIIIIHYPGLSDWQNLTTRGSVEAADFRGVGGGCFGAGRGARCCHVSHATEEARGVGGAADAASLPGGRWLFPLGQDVDVAWWSICEKPNKSEKEPTSRFLASKEPTFPSFPGFAHCKEVLLLIAIAD